MIDISTRLYWSLPGPSEFIGKITDASRHAGAIILSITNYMPNGFWEHVRFGLQNANIPNPVELTITEGMNVEVEVGTHFGVPSMPGESLAHHRHDAPHAIVLKSTGQQSRMRCEQYAASFVKNIEQGQGNVRLLISIQDDERRQDSSKNVIHVIAFDGMLNPSEIDAYVTLRMVANTGPGSTRLLKHLVTEYAGFDVMMAEQLLGMDNSGILGLPESLTPLLGSAPLRWASDSWVGGTLMARSAQAHPLREWYVATHPGDQAAKYKRLSEQRFWRACLKAILPWIEERRPLIMEILDHLLIDLERRSGGPGKIPKKIGERYIEVGREDLELNDLYFFFKNQADLSRDETSAVNICKLAKWIRDDLAHLRKPATEKLISLITEMDMLTT